MNKTIGLQLVIYSLLLAGLSFLSNHLAPSMARVTLNSGLVGAGFCLVWGLRSMLGKRGKALPLLTLAAISFVMLAQTVLTWGGGRQDDPGRQTAALIISALFVLSMAMLTRILYVGMVFDGQQTSSMTDGAAKLPRAGDPLTKANSAKRG